MGLRLGDTVADYRIVSMLGAGGMGAVYQVRHLISDRVEAVKVLLPDLASTPELAERFMREIRLQASLSHPNIVSLHNALRIENQLLMVMEYVEGETLAEVVRRGPLKQIQALEVAAQVLSALEYAHSRDVIHRDVKPSNIILSPKGSVKLMDFGIARTVHDFAQLTQAGAAVGSMYYMSPEQVRGEVVDGRSDIYAAGVTLFEMLIGQRPIQGNSAAEVLDAHLHLAAPRARMMNPAIAPEVSDAVAVALEKEPARRYQTAGDFRARLLSLLTSLRENTADPGPVQVQTRSISFFPKPGGEATPGDRAKTPNTPSATISHPFSFDPLALERVRKEVAVYVGPMAKILVDRAARRSRNWQELYQRLAPEFPAGKERERFLAGCPQF